MKEVMAKVHHFQMKRPGLKEYNGIAHSLTRMDMELDECFEALELGDREALIYELIDVILFAATGLVALDVTDEQASDYLEQKHKMNEHRYDPEFFVSVGMHLLGKIFTAEDAIARAKHFDKNGLPEGSDYY